MLFCSIVTTPSNTVFTSANGCQCDSCDNTAKHNKQQGSGSKLTTLLHEFCKVTKSWEKASKFFTHFFTDFEVQGDAKIT